MNTKFKETKTKEINKGFQIKKITLTHSIFVNNVFQIVGIDRYNWLEASQIAFTRVFVVHMRNY